MKSLLSLLFSLIICFLTHAQDRELENKLRPYFGGLPILQSPDSVLRFAFADTAKTGNKSYYSVFTYYDSLAPTKVTDPNWQYEDSLKMKRMSEYDIYQNYYVTEGLANYDVDVSFRDQITVLNVQDCSMFSRKIHTSNVRIAKRNYRKMKREFSNYFEKFITQRGKSRITGGKWASTYYYLKKGDQTPLLEIRWNRRAHMTSQGNRIYVYRKN